MGNFLNTAVGSYLKAFLAVFLTLVLTQLTSGHSVLELDWGVVLNGALVSFLPMLINILNPHDTRYGANKG